MSDVSRLPANQDVTTKIAGNFSLFSYDTCTVGNLKKRKISGVALEPIHDVPDR